MSCDRGACPMRPPCDSDMVCEVARVDWNAISEIDGMPVHVRMGLTATGDGPADPPDPNFDHWGCWCNTPGCPGPPPRDKNVADGND